MKLLHITLVFNLKNDFTKTFVLAWNKRCEGCTSKVEYLLQKDALHAQYPDDKRGLKHITHVVESLHKHVELEHS